MAFKKALDQQRVAGTARFTFDGLLLNDTEPPVLVCRFAGKGTPGYRTDAIKAVNGLRDRTDKLSERRIQEAAELDADLISKHCVEAWEHVSEDESPGVLAPCTPAKIKEMLLGIFEAREEDFRDFVKWIRNPDNFPNAAEVATSGAALGKP